jgi:hypothetical protein
VRASFVPALNHLVQGVERFDSLTAVTLVQRARSQLVWNSQFEGKLPPKGNLSVQKTDGIGGGHADFVEDSFGFSLRFRIYSSMDCCCIVHDVSVAQLHYRASF